MSDDVGTLGKASLELSAETAPFRRNIDEAKASGRGMEEVLHAIAEAGAIADRELAKVRMAPGQGAESKASASEIVSGVRGISEEAVVAAAEIDKVRISEAQAAESRAAGDQIKENLDGISRNADEAKRKLDEVKLHQSVGGTTLPLLGAALGAGALLAPAAGPAILGLLAAIPALAIGGAGALGTLMLAFNGVGAAIGGNKKAFDALEPAQQKFALDIRSLDGFLDHLKQTAAGNLFPGLDKALHETLTPGTLHLISAGVAELAHALGLAAEQWGRFFGSAEFQQTMGPILHAAAQGIGALSTVMLHLFDALLVLGRAAIPFLNWLEGATVKGAKWLDTLVRSRDATGQLSGAMHEAEVSLTLVGHLIESLARVVFNLGAALYPVSKVAVKDLTDGLNWLSHVIQDNKIEIQSLVGGALTALRGALHIIVPIVSMFVQELDAVVHAVGGWTPAFSIILTGLLVSRLLAVQNTVVGWGSAFAAAAAKAAAKIALITTAETEVETTAVATEVTVTGAFAAIATAASLAVPAILVLTGALAGAYYIYTQLSSALGSLPTNAQASSPAFAKSHKKYLGAYQSYLYEQGQTDPTSGKFVPQPGHHALTFQQWLTKHHPSALATGPTQAQLTANAKKAAAAAAAAAGTGNGAGGAFGSAPPFTTGLGGSGGGSTHPSYHVPVALQDEIAKRWAKFSKDTTHHNERLYLAAVEQAEKLAKDHGESIAPYVADISKAQKLLAAKIAALAAAQAKKTIEKLAAQTAGPEMVLKIAQAAGAPTGVILADQQTLFAAYKTEAEKLKAKLHASTGKAKAEYKAALAKVEQALRSTLESIVSSMQSIYQAAQQKLSSAVSRMEQDVLSQFDAQTQEYLSNTLGVEFFQGGALTPLEQQLQAMQQQDQLQSLTDSLAQAQATGDQAQIDAAQRALDEYNLEQQAAAQRAQADADYAAAEKAYTDQRAVEEAKLTTALDNWSQGVVDGTANISDLNGIADTFGVTLTGLSDPNTGIGYDFSLLQNAANDAAAALANLTAAAGGTSTSSTTSSSGGGGGGSPTPFRVMAAGGAGKVTVPTLFLAGEAGAEDYAFSGGGRRFGDLVDASPSGCGGITVNVNGVVGNPREVAVTIGRELERLRGRGLSFSLS